MPANRPTPWIHAAPAETLAARGNTTRAWLGAPIRVTAGEPSDARPLPPDAEWPTVLLTQATATAALSLEPTLTAALIDRTLGGELDPDPAAGPLTDVERGVLAYAIARWIAGTGWSVVAVLAHVGPAREALGEPWVGWPLELALGDARGRGWLTVSGAPPLRAFDPATPRDRPIVLTALAGHASVTEDELASLREGDVLVPDRVEVRPDTDGAPTGTVLLHARGETAGLRCRLFGGALRYGGIAAHALPEPEAGAAIVTLDLGRIELLAGDLGALGPDAVVADRALDGEITLRRDDDRVVATGALVEVGVEVGVRLRSIRGAA